MLNCIMDFKRTNKQKRTCYISEKRKILITDNYEDEPAQFPRPVFKKMCQNKT